MVVFVLFSVIYGRSDSRLNANGLMTCYQKVSQKFLLEIKYLLKQEKFDFRLQTESRVQKD